MTFRMILLTPVMMLALALWLGYHAGGKPRHYGPMVAGQGAAVHLWERVDHCKSEFDPGCVLYREDAIAFNRRQGVSYASK